MCLIAFAIETAPARPLLLAANRDEFFERPTEPLHRWALPDGTGVVGGRDLRDGGTWLGMNEAGRVAMLTNVRSANPGPGRRSRGELPTRWLKAGHSWEALLSGLDAADYGGFNLVVGDLATGFWAWVSNRHPAQPHAEQTGGLHHRRLAPGVYGLSNAALDTPWPKTLRLKRALQHALSTGPDAQAPLVSALADPVPPEPAELPDTGVPAEWERALSSPFVDLSGRGYGTRSSLLLDVARRGRDFRADFTEWTHAPPPAGPHRWTGTAPRRLQLS
ncbi:NRDE family protein [Hydrogenophaga pseudoflava]|uniref:NRDE family protein n=1 Tax=Hydrogenophaga pseudoflava TaxID=47421 RepID=UPI0027E53F9C|nr:NRDE family protein [Hydrogenophaga pseudoflava]MDQ7744523.1 NRDE family protein [Hydrogenophaga pseudoflava]